MDDGWMDYWRWAMRWMGWAMMDIIILQNNNKHHEQPVSNSFPLGSIGIEINAYKCVHSVRAD
jgi:hypothetical protein